MTRIFLFLMFAFPVMGQYVSPGFNTGTPPPFPGWTVLQDNASQGCGASANNCSMKVAPTTAGSAWIVNIYTTNNVKISQVCSGVSCSGNNDNWTLCPTSNCYKFTSGEGVTDAAYNVSGTTGTTQIKVTLTGSSSGLFYMRFIEVLPPSGSTASFDDGRTADNASCSTTCNGAATTPTATDAIIQLSATQHGLTSFNPWSSPYITTFQSNGIALNTNSGAAPTVAMDATGFALFTAIAFKSSAGTFTINNPTPFYTIVQATNPNGAGCSNVCTLTVPSTGSGHLLFLHYIQENGNSISSISGGGTWVIPSGAGTCAINATPGTQGCAYVLSSSSGVTSVSVTMSANGSTGFGWYEISRSSGSFAVDAQNSVSLAAASTFSGPSLTLTGTNDVIFQEASASGGTQGPSLYMQPYYSESNDSIIINYTNSGVLPNTTNGSAVYYINSPGNAAIASAIAFK